MSSHLGLDLGGTNIKWVVLDGDGRPVADGSLPTEGEGGPDHVIERLALAGRTAAEAAGPVATAGVGVPGIYEDTHGTIRFFTNLPGPWAGHPLGEPLAEAPRCGCGNTGCLEAYVGAGALARFAGTASAAEAFAADQRGDERAHAAVEAWIDHLAIGLANLVTVLTPDRIVLGGGVSTAAARIITPLRDRLRAHVHLTDPDHVEIVHAALGVRAGAIGAALHGLDPA